MEYLTRRALIRLGSAALLATTTTKAFTDIDIDHLLIHSGSVRAKREGEHCRFAAFCSRRFPGKIFLTKWLMSDKINLLSDYRECIHSIPVHFGRKRHIMNTRSKQSAFTQIEVKEFVVKILTFRAVRLHLCLSVLLWSMTLLLTEMTQANAAAPTNLTITGGDMQELVTWSPVTNATGYYVYRSTSAGSEGTTPLNSKPLTANAYLDTGQSNNTALSSGTPYFYTISAVFASAPQSAQSAEASATTSSSSALQDSQWVMTSNPTNSSSTDTVTNTAQAVSFAISQQISAVANNSINGTTSSSLSKQAQVSVGGTCTFTWSGSTWPTLYVIKQLQQRAYQAIIGNATGNASVANTGGTTLVSASYPVTGSAILSAPLSTTTCNTADLTNVIFTTASTSHVAQPRTADGTPTGTVLGWSERLTNLSIINSCYTQAWFQNHFSTPQSIVLTVTVGITDVTAAAHVSSATSTGLCSSIADVSDIFSGS